MELTGISGTLELHGLAEQAFVKIPVMSLIYCVLGCTVKHKDQKNIFAFL